MTHYRIRLADGAMLHFAAARCRQDGDQVVFEEKRSPRGWEVICEIHAANIAQIAVADSPAAPGA